MDFMFLMRKVLLAPNVTLKLDQLVLRNINKLGGFGLDFFMVRWTGTRFCLVNGSFQRMGALGWHALLVLTIRVCSTAGYAVMHPGAKASFWSWVNSQPLLSLRAIVEACIPHHCWPLQPSAAGHPALVAESSTCLLVALCRETRALRLMPAIQSGSNLCAPHQNSPYNPLKPSVRQ